MRSLKILVLIVLSCLPVAAAAQDAKPASDAGLQEAFTWKFRNGISLRLYGRLEMLTYYDTTVPYISDWLAFVEPKGSFKGDNGSFSMSVRASPLGLHLNVPDLARGWALNARVEVDFVGGFLTGAMSAYSPLMRLKQAWVSVDSAHVSILAGQHFGIFGPLFPDTANWIQLGTSGNPWIRLPQIRLTLKWDPIKFELSANRPMGGNEVFTDSVNDLISDGELSKMPFFMARLGYAQDFGPVSLGVGVSGVYGRERVRRDDPATGVKFDRDLNIWMASADLKIGSKYVDLLGEFYMGENLNSFFAGILQGITITKNDAWSIRDIGGWAQVAVRPVANLSLVGGAGVDKPELADLLPDLAGKMPRALNLTGWGAINYRIAGTWLVGAESSYTRTSYLNDKGTNSNVRVVLKTSFGF